MLSNATVTKARVRDRAYKLWDEDGLHLHVATSGTKAWRFRCRAGGREIVATLGHWPELSLADARDRRDDARRRIRTGEDPATSIQDVAVALTFEAAARAWHAQQLRRWSPVHAADVITSLERHVLPAIGALPLAAIGAPAVLALLRAVEETGAIETARRLRQRISAVFARAIAEGVVTGNPADVVRRALEAPRDARHQSAATDLPGARAAFAAIEAAAAPAPHRLMSRLLALTAVRSAAVRGARWDEFEDLAPRWGTMRGEPVRIDRPTWRVPAARMKLVRSRKADPANDHLVPLSRQAVAVLEEARAIGGDGGLVFPGRDPARPIGENALSELYGRAGLRGRHSPHGWRASFATILNETFPADRAAIDAALAHSARDKVEAAYNRATFHERRRVLFQEWADLLIG